MKRRLVLAATALAIISGSAVAASAAGPTASPQLQRPKPGQICLLLFYDDGGNPGHLCLNW